MYDIRKNMLFGVGIRSVIASCDMHIADDAKGYFVLDMWEQCDYKDISVLPVTFLEYQTLEERYVILRENIILGSEMDACLI